MKKQSDDSIKTYLKCLNLCYHLILKNYDDIQNEQRRAAEEEGIPTE